VEKSMNLKLLAYAFLAAFAAPALAADDFLAAAPGQTKVLKEDAKVRVVEFKAKKGDKIPMHSHPAHVVYFVKSGKTKFTFPDGSTRESKAGDGEAIISAPITHSQEHLEDVHVILVEMKQ
jgi:quercetin dioxygenase-like cupin family protein